MRCPALFAPKFLAVVASLSLATLTPLAAASLTTYDNGATNGWGVFNGNDGGLGDFILPEGGNPGGNLQFIMVDTFGVTLKNDSNPDVLGNYARFGANTKFSVDLKANSIAFFGSEVARHLVVELVDNNPDGSDYPYTSVWYDLGTISSTATADWTKFSVTLADPTSPTLPAGWGGYGAETPLGEPILPANRTFASVLASVDEIRFTTYVPGYFYGFTDFNLQFDNIALTPGAIPEPTTAILLTPAAALLMRRKR